jgi:hypothetical protein
LGVQVTWHWYDGVRAPFPLSDWDDALLKHAMRRLLREKRRRDSKAGLQSIVSNVERAYLLGGKE